MAKPHTYEVQTRWTGNLGSGTSDYRAYSRQHEVASLGKSAPILGSSDPVFRGDGTRYNPEELLVASISTCHLLWYLHLCADAGIVVVDYVDAAHGTMVEAEDGGGHFTEVVLRPQVSITRAEQLERARALHEEAHRKCFIANSLNFPVKHVPDVRVAQGAAPFASR
jgi:organic hydroperoxide reductase OsmC/OhrA